MWKNIFKILIIFIIGAIGGIFSDQILWPYFIERPLFLEYRLEQRPVYLTEKKEITIQENVALQNAIRKTERVVIGVRTETKAGKILQGSGLIVASDGLVITLANLVPRDSSFSFFIDGEQVSFQILKRDLEKNLALVKVEKTNLLTVAFANLEKLKLGERVFLVGLVNPRQTEKTVNEGIIKRFGEDFIETNIFEKPIIAGSPLFNIEGEILGLNTVDLEGKVITIPITKIRQFLKM